MAIRTHYEILLKKLLEIGSEELHSGTNMERLLKYAVDSKNYDAARLLIQNGANPDEIIFQAIDANNIKMLSILFSDILLKTNGAKEMRQNLARRTGKNVSRIIRNIVGQQALDRRAAALEGAPEWMKSGSSEGGYRRRHRRRTKRHR
jgi:hypothetical protein